MIMSERRSPLITSGTSIPGSANTASDPGAKISSPLPPPTISPLPETDSLPLSNEASSGIIFETAFAIDKLCIRLTNVAGSMSELAFATVSLTELAQLAAFSPRPT